MGWNGGRWSPVLFPKARSQKKGGEKRCFEQESSISSQKFVVTDWRQSTAIIIFFCMQLFSNLWHKAVEKVLRNPALFSQPSHCWSISQYEVFALENYRNTRMQPTLMCKKFRFAGTFQQWPHFLGIQTGQYFFYSVPNVQQISTLTFFPPIPSSFCLLQIPNEKPLTEAVSLPCAASPWNLHQLVSSDRSWPSLCYAGKLMSFDLCLLMFRYPQSACWVHNSCDTLWLIRVFWL